MPCIMNSKLASLCCFRARGGQLLFVNTQHVVEKRVCTVQIFVLKEHAKLMRVVRQWQSCRTKKMSEWQHVGLKTRTLMSAWADCASKQHAPKIHSHRFAHVIAASLPLLSFMANRNLNSILWVKWLNDCIIIIGGMSQWCLFLEGRKPQSPVMPCQPWSFFGIDIHSSHSDNTHCEPLFCASSTSHNFWWKCPQLAGQGGNER